MYSFYFQWRSSPGSGWAGPMFSLNVAAYVLTSQTWDSIYAQWILRNRFRCCLFTDQKPTRPALNRIFAFHMIALLAGRLCLNKWTDASAYNYTFQSKSYALVSSSTHYPVVQSLWDTRRLELDYWLCFGEGYCVIILQRLYRSCMFSPSKGGCRFTFAYSQIHTLLLGGDCC